MNRKAVIPLPVVKLTLGEDSYNKLLAKAKKEGLSVQDFIKRKTIGEATAYTPLEAVRKAKASYKSGAYFTLPDVYGDSWDLKRGLAGVFGKQFFNFVVDHPEYGIRFDKMTDGRRRAQYKIVAETEGVV